MGLTYSGPPAKRGSVFTAGFTSGNVDVLNFLLKTDLFSPRGNFSLSEVKELAGFISSKKLNKGEQLFTQGETADVLYLVAQGKVGLVHKTSNLASKASQNSRKAGRRKRGKKQDLDLQTVERGEVVGWVDVSHDWSYQCSAIARSSVIALYIEKKDLEKLANVKAAQPILDYFTKVKEIPEFETLKTMMLLTDVDQEMMRVVVQLLIPKIYPKGTRLLSEGVKEGECYFICKGQVVATIKDGDGIVRELAKISQGKCVGERSLMDSTKTCICSITTLTEVQALTLSRADFDKFLELCPRAESKLTRRKNNFNKVDELLGEVEAFKALSTRKKLLLAYCVKELNFPKGSVIIQEGVVRPEKENLLHIVVEGSAEVFKKNRRIRVIGRGGFFGELSIVQHDGTEPAAATVKAETDLKCFSLDRASFQRLFAREQALLAEILIKILGKNAPLEVLLRHPVTRKSIEAHCAAEMSAENVHFWLAVSNLEALADATVSSTAQDILGFTTENKKKNLLKTKAVEIYETYIKEGSSQEVNIIGSQREELDKKISGGNFDFHMFADAKSAVFQLMNNDTFTRYKRSLKFANILRQFKTYTGDDDLEEDISEDSGAENKTFSVDRFYELLYKKSSIFSRIDMAKD